MIKIGLKLAFHDHYDTSVAYGVLKYAKKKIDWEINGEGHWFNNSTQELDALIARIETEEEKERYELLNIPVVDIAGAIRSNKFSTVRNDDWDTGVKCGDYLYKIGSKHYAIALVSHVAWARERMIGFCRGAVLNSEKLNTFSRPLAWWQQLYSDTNPELEKWLLSLEQGTSLFCCNDLCAMKISVTCRKLKIDIPYDLRILGVDNEELLCMLAKPTISSIALQLESIGYTAAKVLDEILSKENESNKIVYRIPPLAIVERESTTIIDREDSIVENAISIIKMNVSSIYSVSDIVDQLPCSRRSLEIKFKKVMNSSIHNYIINEKLNRANSLLLSTNDSIK
ncbi:MAG: substrate-binding domain-containing protein, partial [Spirochaetaceae bacterium]|nr:substrate-binding domain-containing protein [Spirochaetaceae bacterium]